MAVMGSYCKAYAIERLAAFPGWRPKPVPHPSAFDAAAAARDASGPRYLFLQETFVVTDGIFIDENVVFDDVTDEWKRFCTESLGFEVPKLEEVPEPDSGHVAHPA